MIVKVSNQTNTHSIINGDSDNLFFILSLIERFQVSKIYELSKEWQIFPNDGVPVAAARRIEEEFFKDHPVYSRYTNLCGTANLSRKLSELLYLSIRKALPDIKREIEHRIAVQNDIIKRLGEAIPTHQGEKPPTLEESFETWII